ncbi:MAG: hypothetical protein IT525_13915 [Nitrosomonas sp.]|nr:hypothetical protein [Nitrosomonas sp.]
MDQKGKYPVTGDLFQQLLTELINLKHPLVKLAELIDWSVQRPEAWCHPSDQKGHSLTKCR